MLLYHGSRHGIDGPIAPLSRDRCDFGRGFYLGTEPLQPLTLICDFPDARFYTVELDLDGLDVRELSADATSRQDGAGPRHRPLCRDSRRA